jgi:GT2 family glycosyltransferase
MPTTRSQSVAAVVLNWNNYEDTHECVESLGPHLNEDDQIVVVDNGSVDDSLTHLQEAFPDVAYVTNDQNRGFAGGMNSGIEWARREDYETVLLLNNDVVVSEETAIHDLGQKATEPGVGLVTPLIVEHPGDSLWFARGVIDERWVRFAHETEVDTNHRYLRNEYVPLCCSMLSLSVLDEVGDLDEEYFLYCEDAELGEQLRDLGYDLLTDTTARARHKVSGSSESSFSPVPSYYRTRNRHRFYRNQPGGRNPLAFTIYSIWWVTTRSMWALATSGIDGALAVCRGELDGWRGKWGKGPY